MGVIFDLDQTIIDSRIAFQERINGNWRAVYDLIPYMTPYTEIVNLIQILVEQGEEVAIVTSSPSYYCNKVLDFLGIRGVIKVCYHDTAEHKPHPEPLLLAIEKMKNKDLNQIYAVGDDENDLVAAANAGVIGVWGYWGNYHAFNNRKRGPAVFCKNPESLIQLFKATGVIKQDIELVERARNIYQLFDYYPQSRIHDALSRQIFNEVKERNEEINLCDIFCYALLNLRIISSTCAIFVVPSSTAGKWNGKLVNHVVPKLAKLTGGINCAEHIVRRITHEKQAYGGERSVESNLKTMGLNRMLPEGITHALIVDDITTTGNIFEACKAILCQAGIERENIYCAAIGGTV